jgi:hypothetical protein
VAWALATTALAALAAYGSVVGFGLGPCGGSGGVPNEAPRARDAICKIMFGHKPGTLIDTSNNTSTVRPILWIALPVTVTLAGVLIAAVTQRPRRAGAGGIIAAILIVLPWVALWISSVIQSS